MSSRHPHPIPFYSIRNISSPDDLESNRRIYVGCVPLSSIVELPTDENVRDYLVEAEGKLRKRPSQVHRAIRDTLINNPSDFCVLNSGITAVARDCEIDEKRKCILLTLPSIINGSQTQGVIKDLVQETKKKNPEEVGSLLEVPVKCEIIVTDDDSLIADISIARNFQNDVMTLSIAGRKGQLDELDEAMRKAIPGKKLKTSETKLSDDYIETERLLQVIAALIPEELWIPGKEFSKVYTYSRKAQCLKEFQAIYEGAHDTKCKDHTAFQALYKFYLDIAPEAYDLYESWKTHQGFIGTGLRAIKREGNKITDVPDGILFPIVAAHSAFVKKVDGRWTISKPTMFNDKDMIAQAKNAHMDMANSNPNVMGKSKGCYSSLYNIACIYKKLSTS